MQPRRLLAQSLSRPAAIVVKLHLLTSPFAVCVYLSHAVCAFFVELWMLLFLVMFQNIEIRSRSKRLVATLANYIDGESSIPKSGVNCITLSPLPIPPRPVSSVALGNHEDGVLSDRHRRSNHSVISENPIYHRDKMFTFNKSQN